MFNIPTPLQVKEFMSEADLNGDGFRGIDDLLIILSSYNGTPMQGTEDLTGDGFVGVDDILDFLLYFDQACD